MAKTKTKNEDLESWMQKTTQGHSKGRAKSDDWPDKVIEEIKYVLKFNLYPRDASGIPDQFTDMLARRLYVHQVGDLAVDSVKQLRIDFNTQLMGYRRMMREGVSWEEAVAHAKQA